MIEPTLSSPIGVFDSGLGGLTVVRSLLEDLPQESLIYLGDTARVPYGTKSREAIFRFAEEGSAFLLGKGIKLMVLACNTMSATALPELAARLGVPVVGVIDPGVEEAIRVSTGGRIGVIGTAATIGSQAYRRSIQARKPEWLVFSQACPLFVPLVEEGWEETEVAAMTARHYLAPLLAQGIDTLVLGCTHYPLLLPTLRRVVGSDIRIVDSATQTSREVKNLLARTVPENPGPASPMRCYLTDIPPSFIGVADRFLGRPVTHVERASLTP
ncbi:glutamate racemase [Candidatus Fermentibacteria bacterium]|nr:glutamate racemase [Candidatus Fermentibacteria bacterium]